MSIAVSIIEDDASVRKILAGWVNQAKGFRCVSEHDSVESALPQLPEINPDVVLVDINLPGQNGIQCVGQLKPLMPKTQFLMVTVYEDSDHIFDALAAGASGYLLKRTPREELLTSIKQVYEGGSPMQARRNWRAFLRAKGKCWNCSRTVFFTRKLPSRSRSASRRSILISAAFTKSFMSVPDPRPWPGMRKSPVADKRQRPSEFIRSPSGNWPAVYILIVFATSPFA